MDREIKKEITIKNLPEGYDLDEIEFIMTERNHDALKRGYKVEALCEVYPKGVNTDVR